MGKIKIILADDHPLFRYGVRAKLESIPDVEILSETGDGREALDLIIKLNPDIAILDFEMPGLNGLEITNKLNELNSPVKVILLTMHDQKKIFFKALDVGVKGYVLKDDAVLDIVHAVNSVALGKEFISSNIAGLLVEKIKNYSADNKINNLINELSPAEKKILSLIAELKTNDEIAESLFLSKRTIENHKVSLTKKLQLQSSRELLKFAIKNGDYLKGF